MVKNNIISIIVAGGKGKRMGKKVPKQFLKIGNLPIIVRTLMKFQKSKTIDGIILVLPQKWKTYGKKLLEKYHLSKVIKVVNAGTTRQASVYNGLSAAAKFNPDFVIIHDGVRPFVNITLIEKSVVGAKKYGACAAAITPKDTLFDKGKHTILNREKIISIQTPQAFKFSTIWEAHKKARKRKKWDFSDDSSLLLFYNIKTNFIKGERKNIKITVIEDLEIAQLISRDEKPFK